MDAIGFRHCQYTQAADSAISRGFDINVMLLKLGDKADGLSKSMMPLTARLMPISPWVKVSRRMSRVSLVSMAR